MKTYNLKFIARSASHFFLLLILLLGITLLPGCDKGDPELEEAQLFLDEFLAGVDQDLLDAELAVIDDSLSAWGLTSQVLSEPFGVRYIIHEKGTGAKPVLNDNILINYSGKLLKNGKVFDSNNNIDLLLYYLIPGFQTTFPLIEEGTIFTLYIPSIYGYADQERFDQQGNVTIPKYSNLIFDIEFLEVL